MVYVTRSHYSLVGSGALVVMRNAKDDAAYSAPDTARRFFSRAPSSVSIESHTYFEGEGEVLVFELAKSLAQSQQPLLLSMDDRITAVKSNPYLSDSDRFLQLGSGVSGFIPEKASFPILELALKERVGARVWKELSENARAFLLTGFVAFDGFDGPSSVSLETSPGVIALSKALEDVIVERLQEPFRRAILNSAESIPASSDGRLNKLRDFATRRNSRPLELGTFASQIIHLNTADISALPPTAVKFADFIGRLSDPEYLQFLLASDLLAMTRNYRNRAAHPDPMNFADLKSLLTLLLGGETRDGLLATIVEATRPAAR
ncbi:hypothetical protein TZ00_02790 [Agreia bicolorata]|uniref:ApeA N-terminal domain-containing protein n=1 Tax=Agreia bicolorata TaxID=110935 RepID=A0ABR5CJH2_9MICO|nr:hypothetical protein TZ00_02790 [Agreia bicolorata]